MLQLTSSARAQRNIQRGLGAVGADYTAQIVCILGCIKGREEAPAVTHRGECLVLNLEEQLQLSAS